MSLWSDYKAGLLTESEYTAMCRREYLEDLDRGDDCEEEEAFEDDEIDEF